MQPAFIVLIVIHGLIHMIGFFHAFGFELEGLTMNVSKPMGVLWLAIALLFLSTVLLLIRDNSYWTVMGLAAAILSQILIFTVWGEAKFGTIVNLVILLTVLPAYGSHVFKERVEKEQRELIEHAIPPSNAIIEDDHLLHLPAVVQKWLRVSGVPGKPEVNFVRLKQKGKMKTSPDSNWMEMEAVQYFDVKQPSFIWYTNVRMMPFVSLAGRDRLKEGKGEMLIKLFSIVNVVDEKGTEQVDTGTLLRFLGEMSWFPSAALNEYIEWESQGPLSAKATMTVDNERVSGLFRYRESGEMKSFEAERYYGGESGARKETWLVEAQKYKDFDGYRLPASFTVTWKLEEGDFQWLNLEITDLQVNEVALYEKGTE